MCIGLIYSTLFSILYGWFKNIIAFFVELEMKRVNKRMIKQSLSTGCSRYLARSRDHERTISLRFLGIILRVLTLEISVYNVYIRN